VQVNPGLKAAIIKVLEDSGGKIEDGKGGCVKAIYDAIPNASYKPSPNNMNVVTKALEYLADSGRVTLNRRGSQRKLYSVSHRERHDGPAGVIATQLEVEPDIAFAVTLVPAGERIIDLTDEPVIERIRKAGPMEVAKELLGLVVQVAQMPATSGADLAEAQQKCQVLGDEVTRLQEKLDGVTKQAAKDAAAAKEATQRRREMEADLRDARRERDHLRADKTELTEMLRIAEDETSEWKQKAMSAARVAAQYQDSFVDGLVNGTPGMPPTSLADILDSAAKDLPKRRDG
jgi:hypothetical protein